MSSDEWILPIIEALVSADAASRAELAANGSVWDAAIRLRLVPEQDLLNAVSKKLSTPIAPDLQVSDAARDLVPERIARKYQVLPLAASAHTLDVATANPWDLDAERSIAFVNC